MKTLTHDVKQFWLDYLDAFNRAIAEESNGDVLTIKLDKAELIEFTKNLAELVEVAQDAGDYRPGPGQVLHQADYLPFGQTE